MSKRLSTGSNTLFNYFVKSPPSKLQKNNVNGQKEDIPVPSKVENSVNNTEVKNQDKKRVREETKHSTVKREEQSDDDDVSVGPKKKRIRIRAVESSDESDTENRADNTPAKMTVEKKLQDSFKYEQKPVGASPQTKSKKPTTNESCSQPPPASQDSKSVANDDNWTHCKLDWLRPDKLRDAKKRRPDHPEYDPTTLFVPDEFKKTQTPAHRQWWEMKSSHFDCVLFFKVGKFYELYHMDATVGVNELGFTYMRGEYAHSGFPESAYARMASTLVSKGYKVARVEQTETPDMVQERCKRTGQNSKWDKVVKREICQVTCKGTEICGFQDNGPTDAATNYMMAIVEQEGNKGQTTYGVCFIDTSIGQFNLGQFDDDKHCSRLLTTLAHYPPALVLIERRTISPRTSKVLSTHCHAARKEGMVLFRTPEKTLKLLAENYYKTNADGEWPDGLKPFLHDGDSLGLSPADNSYLAIKALGACIDYLTTCLLDIQILGMAQFTPYVPSDVASTQVKREGAVWQGGNTMVLDAITLRNLRVVGEEGSLYDKLNYCCTAMGKRLLHQWVCAPSCNVAVIKERQAAVAALLEDQSLCQDTRALLTRLPDLERLLAKMHSLGNLKRSKDHPDARAIFFERSKYSKKQVLDFIAVLNGFETVLKLEEMFGESTSMLLRNVTSKSPTGKFPDYVDTLKFFKESFDHKEAASAGHIIPGEGVDTDYDESLRDIQLIQQELQEYLKDQEKYFKCRIVYVGSDKKRYQLEVPESAARKAGSDYQLESARKGFKRFSTAETKDLLARMMSAEEQKTTVLKDICRRIFAKFSSSYSEWEGAVRCVATVDVLLSFAEFARLQQGDVCLPEVGFAGERCKPYLSITDGRHPCIPILDDFIPNDSALGCEDSASLLLLTGPNMGGKSTLMRQIGLLSILAQLGSYIPASACSLTVVDRIFTRLGASDDILSGQSTFLVEMNETAAILKHATPHSLVLLDELGRGTSTYDGTAIAAAVVADLAQRGCRTVFSTHYHSLVQDFRNQPGVELGHMACMVETEEPTENEDDIPEETITFLYKLTPGACPKSYGFNAARLAGIPREITRSAQIRAASFEREWAQVRAFRDICKVGKDRGSLSIRLVLKNLKI